MSQGLVHFASMQIAPKLSSYVVLRASFKFRFRAVPAVQLIVDIKKDIILDVFAAADTVREPVQRVLLLTFVGKP